MRQWETAVRPTRAAADVAHHLVALLRVVHLLLGHPSFATAASTTIRSSSKRGSGAAGWRWRRFSRPFATDGADAVSSLRTVIRHLLRDAPGRCVGPSCRPTGTSFSPDDSRDAHTLRPRRRSHAVSEPVSWAVEICDAGAVVVNSLATSDSTPGRMSAARITDRTRSIGMSRRKFRHPTARGLDPNGRWASKRRPRSPPDVATGADETARDPRAAARRERPTPRPRTAGVTKRSWSYLDRAALSVL